MDDMGDMDKMEQVCGYLRMIERTRLLLVLLVLKLLPRLSAKGGDVRDIRQDYRRLFSWLSETVNKDIMMQKLPLLTQMEDEIRHDPDNMCRLHLISTANQILNSFGALSTRERISISNKELLENQFDPEVGGIWTENEFSTVFWRFEGIANGYHLYRYQADCIRPSTRLSSFSIRGIIPFIVDVESKLTFPIFNTDALKLHPNKDISVVQSLIYSLIYSLRI